MANFTLQIVDHSPPFLAVDLNHPMTVVPGMFDETNPEVVDVVPTDGADIQRTTSISFAIEDDTKIRQAFIFAYFASGQRDVVYDTHEFSPAYTKSTINKVSDRRWEVVVRKLGGWVTSPSIKVNGIDIGGNVTS